MATVGTVDVPVFAEFNGERYDLGTLTLDLNFPPVRTGGGNPEVSIHLEGPSPELLKEQMERCIRTTGTDGLR